MPALVKARMYVMIFHFNIYCVITTCICANSMRSIKLTTINPRKRKAHAQLPDSSTPPPKKCCSPQAFPMSTHQPCRSCSLALERQHRHAEFFEDFERVFRSTSNSAASNSSTQPTPKDSTYICMKPMERFLSEPNNVQPAFFAVIPCLNTTPAPRH